ncbi:hypothetical protein D3C80_2185530 [compost metagenome]
MTARPGRKVGVRTTPRVRVSPSSGFRSGLPLLTDGLVAIDWVNSGDRPKAAQFALRLAG